MVAKQMTTIWKRLLGLLLILLMLTSCGADEVDDSAPQRDYRSWEGSCC